MTILVHEGKQLDSLVGVCLAVVIPAEDIPIRVVGCIIAMVAVGEAAVVGL